MPIMTRPKSEKQLLNCSEKIYLWSRMRRRDGRESAGPSEKAEAGLAKSFTITTDPPPDDLIWFYFKRPNGTWEMLCDTAGWIVVCDNCHQQTSYFEEIMN